MAYVFNTGYFPFLVGHWKDLEGFREDGKIRRGLYSERMKGFGESCTTSSSREELLRKKINNQDVYLDYGSIEDIPEDALRLYGDSTALS